MSAVTFEEAKAAFERWASRWPPGRPMFSAPVDRRPNLRWEVATFRLVVDFHELQPLRRTRVMWGDRVIAERVARDG